jgi:hypothetical protein
MLIEVVQFIPPNGDTEIIRGYLSDELNDQYEAMKSNGCRLTMEILKLVDMASLTIEEPDLGDFMIEVIPLTKDAGPAFEKMLREFDVKKFKEWKKIMEQE